jgi:xanthosine utilization system XapX-like protein
VIDLKIGLKAGFLSGIFYGLLTAVITYVFFSINKESIINAINATLSSQNSTISASELYETVLRLSPIMNITVGITGGLMLGIIYSVIHERIPLKSYFIKGVLISLIAWFITNWSYIAFLLNGDYYTIFGLIAALISGGLLGFLYRQFSLKPLVTLPSSEVQKSSNEK